MDHCKSNRAEDLRKKINELEDRIRVAPVETPNKTVYDWYRDIDRLRDELARETDGFEGEYLEERKAAWNAFSPENENKDAGNNTSSSENNGFRSVSSSNKENKGTGSTASGNEENKDAGDSQVNARSYDKTYDPVGMNQGNVSASVCGNGKLPMKNDGLNGNGNNNDKTAPQPSHRTEPETVGEQLRNDINE